MIDEGIASGKYVETSDTTQTDLKHLQDFLYRHFKDMLWWNAPGFKPTSRILCYC